MKPIVYYKTTLFLFFFFFFLFSALGFHDLFGTVAASPHNTSSSISNKLQSGELDFRSFFLTIEHTNQKKLRAAVDYFREVGFLASSKRFLVLAKQEKNKKVWFAMRTFSDLLLETEYIERLYVAEEKNNRNAIHHALSLLETVGEYRSVKPVVSLLRKETERRMRKRAIEVLAAVERRNKIIRDMASLKTGSEWRRTNAARRLALLDDDWRLIPTFEDYLDDSVVEIQLLFARYLAERKNKKGIFTLIFYIKKTETFPEGALDALFTAEEDGIYPLLDLFRVRKENFRYLLFFDNDPFSLKAERFKKKLMEELLKRGSDVLPYLSYGLESKDRNLQIASIELAGELKGKEYFKQLLNLTDKDDFFITLSVIHAFGKIKDNRSILFLLSRLSGKEQQVMDAAVQALKYIGRDVLRFLYHAWRHVGDDTEKKVNIIKILHYLNDLSSFDVYVNALQDEQFSVRMCALDSLASLKDERAIEFFLDALKSEKRLRDIALRGIFLIKDKVAKRLAAEIDTLDYDAGRSVSAMLGRIKDVFVVKPLIRQIAKDKRNLKRNEAVKALINIGGLAVPDLIEALKDDNDLIRAGAAWALAQIGYSGALEPVKNMIISNFPDVYIAKLPKSTNVVIPFMSLEWVNAAEEALRILETKK